MIRRWVSLVLAAALVPACHDGSDDDDAPAPPVLPPTAAPAAPQNLRADPGDGQVRLTWDAAAGASSYTVKRGIQSGGPFAPIQGGLQETTFLDSGLQNGTTFFYVVSAVNAAGESPNSAESNATPRAGPPPPPTLFTKSGTNPALTGASAPSVLKLGPTSWVMYFGSASGNAPIGRATSTDGNTWVKNPGSVFAFGAHPSVLFDGTTFRMWYKEGDNAISLATSPDGIHWIRHPSSPVFRGSPAPQPDFQGPVWDSLLISATVLQDGPEFKMWYAAMNGTGNATVRQIGYATSPDGITWTRHPTPVLSPSPRDPGDFPPGFEHPAVIKDENLFRMWFNNVFAGDTDSIGSATSPDGITWTLDAGPALTVGDPGEWDSAQVWGVSVVRDGPELKMWYTGTGPAGAESVGAAKTP